MTVLAQEPVLSDPPERNRGRGRSANPVHKKAADLAKENPGRWVRVGDFKSSQSGQIQRGKHGSYPGEEGTWEATTRTSEEDEDLKTLWVRWVGK